MARHPQLRQYYGIFLKIAARKILTLVRVFAETLTQESSMPPVNPQASKSTNPLITACRDTTQKRGRFSWPSRGAVVGAAWKATYLTLLIISTVTQYDDCDLKDHGNGDYTPSI